MGVLLRSPQQQAVERAVADVLDPCSRLNGTWLSFGELGMIDAVTIDGAGAVVVRLVLDDPTCTYTYDIMRALQAAAGAVAGVTDVSVQIRGDAIWTEDFATAAAQAKIAGWRAQRVTNIERRCAAVAATCGTCAKHEDKR